MRSNSSDANDQPSTLDFKYEIKRYILGKFSTLFYANVQMSQKANQMYPV